MKIRKKTLAFICASTLVMGTTACGFTAFNSKTPEKEATATDTIHFWHIYGSDSDPTACILKQITRDAEDKFHVNIKVDTAENEDYKTKLKAAFAANETPDIFYTWGNGFLKPLVDSGKVLKLDDYFTKDYTDHLSSTMMSGIEFAGGTYALPVDSTVAMLFINKELMTRYHLETPKTFDELIEVCRIFIDQGITPLSVGGNEPWTIAMYYDLLALREVGADGIRASAEKKADYSDPGYLQAAKDLMQLVDMGAFPEDSVMTLREEAEALFLQGKVPIYLNGSWTCARIYKETSEVAGKIEAIPFPITDSGKSTIYDFTGGPDSSFAVGASTKDPALTVRVAQYLALELSKELYKQGSSTLPYINVDLDSVEVNPLLLDIRSYTDQASSYTIWWDNLLDGPDALTYLDNLQSLFAGKLTPEEYIEQMNILSKTKGE